MNRWTIICPYCQHILFDMTLAIGSVLPALVDLTKIEEHARLHYTGVVRFDLNVYVQPKPL